ncbi:MAG: RHS repeat protein, partial [Clostridia bacterium]|nr:RHS repeat protein [Clostridia bacterium]
MTKLLQIPQKSGLNQNNIMVASATEQQIQSRAVDIDPANLQLPITCTTQLFGVKTDGTVLNQAQVVCNSSQRIHVAINVQTGHPFSTVSQALLLIKKVSGSGSFAVFPATANNVVQPSAEVTNFVTEVTSGSDVYFAIDITAQVRNNVAKMIYLAICSESGSSCTLCSHLHTNKPSVEVAFVKEDPDFTEIVPIEDAIGANGAYSVNVRNGKLMYTQRVYQAPGGYLPFALSMSYCATDYATAVPNGITRPLTGWIFNYDQSIRVSGNNLIYLDGNHRYHEFVPAGNSSTAWSNATAKDGTYIIKKSDGKYQLTDGKAMTMNFNTDNRLAEIVAPNGQKIEITYTGGNISQIVVGSQATYTLTYSSQTITLKKGNVVLSTITLNSAGRPTAVTNGQTDNGYTFAYNGSLLLSKVTDIASKQVAEFAYNTAQGVASVKRSIKNPSEQASSAVFFTYDNKRTIVSHCRNTHSVGSAYKKMEYLFAEDGTLLDSFERIGADKYEGLSFKDKDDYMLHYSRINSSPYWDVDFNGQKSISLKTTSVSNAQVSTAEKSIERSSLIKQCILTGQAFIGSSNYVPDGGSGKIAIYLMEDGVELCHLEFDGNSRERQVISKAFELTDESHTIKVVAKIENMRADVLLDNIKLIPLLGSAVTEFTTSNTGNDNHEDHEGVTWYEKDKVSFTHNAVELVTNVKYTQKDHLLTMQSKAKDPTNFNVWYNDGANVLCGVDDDVEIKFAKQPFYSYLREHTFCSRTFAPGKEIYSYPVVDTVLKVITKTHVAKVVSEEIVHDTFQTEQCFNTQGQVTQEIDQDGVVTTYTYNSDGQLTKTRVEASGSLMNIEQSNTYYDNKMLKSTVEKRESSTYSQLYFYGTNLELTSETFPNGLSHYYTYSPSNDMLTTISTTQSNADPKNVIAYDGDLVTRLTHNGTTFCFAYDTQNNIDSVQIEGANTAIISKEITYDSSGTTQSVTTYGNGQVIKKYYDKYDRLIKIASVSGTRETALAKYIYSDNEVASSVTEPTDSSLSISANSKLRVVIDTVANTKTSYVYDATGQAYAANNEQVNVSLEKDGYCRVSKTVEEFEDYKITNHRDFKNTNTDELVEERVAAEKNGVASIITTTYTTDTLGRP